MRANVIVRISWRNLWRHTRRTMLTVTTVSLGLALLLISLGLGDGSHRQMVDAAVRLGSGHVLIQQRGYQAEGALERFLERDQATLAQEWVKKQGQTFAVHQSLRRVFASGLASSAEGSTGVQILGVEPDAEASASRFDEKVISGSFLHNEARDQVVIGEGVARKLAVSVGQKIVLMAQEARTTEIQSRLVRVSGILRTGMEAFDQMLVVTDLQTAQQFLGLDEAIHQIALFLPEEPPSQALALQGKRELPGLEVLHWSDALPELRDYIRIDDGGNYVFYTFIFLLVGFTVMNTLLMSVLERGREFALLEAVGLTPGNRFAMVLVESGFLAFLSSLLGLTVGYAFHWYLHTRGLPLEIFYTGEISAAGVALDPVLYSDLSFNRLAGSILLIFALTLLLALLPALRAARAGDIRLLRTS